MQAPTPNAQSDPDKKPSSRKLTARQKQEALQREKELLQQQEDEERHRQLEEEAKRKQDEIDAFKSQNSVKLDMM